MAVDDPAMPSPDLDQALGYLLEEAQSERFARDTEDIIAVTLDRVQPAERLSALVSRLTDYFDGYEDAANVFLLMCTFTVSELVADGTIEPKSVPLVEKSQDLRMVTRRIAGLYGAEISKAFDARDFEPTNWATVEMTYSFYPRISSYQAELNIVRFDETSLNLAGPVESILKLVNFIMSELTAAPAPAEAFGDELSDFRHASIDFLAQFDDDELAEA